jgi:hypothetical protein
LKGSRRGQVSEPEGGGLPRLSVIWKIAHDLEVAEASDKLCLRVWPGDDEVKEVTGHRVGRAEGRDGFLAAHWLWVRAGRVWTVLLLLLLLLVLLHGRVFAEHVDVDISSRAETVKEVVYREGVRKLAVAFSGDEHGNRRWSNRVKKLMRLAVGADEQLICLLFRVKSAGGQKLRSVGLVFCCVWYQTGVLEA